MEPATSELGQPVLGNSTNARLLSTATNPSPFQPMVLSTIGSWQNWSRHYHRAIAVGSDRVAFYNRMDGNVRIMKFTAGGGASVVGTNAVVEGYDEVLYGEFGGSSVRKDLLLYSRDTGGVRIYEIDATGGVLTPIRGTTLARTPQDGRWDLITSGYLGQTSNVDDLVVYNKAEGRLRIYRDTPAGYLPIKEHVGLSRTFDQVVAGKFDGDTRTDFAFYNQDGGGVVGSQDLVSATNPLNGHLRILSFANLDTPTLLSESFDAWPMHRNVILVPGEFGGDARTDLVAYTGEPDGTSRATYWINGGTGGLIPIGTDTSWQGRWNSIVALNVDGGSRSDLFLYTRQVEVKLIAVADRDPRAGIRETNRELHTQLAAQIEELNAAYAPAGIYFTLNGDVAEIDLDEVDGHDVTSDERCWSNTDANRAAMNAWAAELRLTYPRHIPLVVRESGRGSGGCSSPDVDFVFLARPLSLDHDHYTRGSATSVREPTAPKHLGHELGHFFTLDHSQPESWKAAPASRYGYDSDTGNVWDTPPNPSSKSKKDEADNVIEPSPWKQTSNPCDDSGGNNLTIDGPDGQYTLNPERHDMMAKGYGSQCDHTYRVSPDQARAIHEGYYGRTWLQ